MSDSRKLVRLCAAYFLCYVGTGIAVKYFTNLSSSKMSQISYLICNTAGSSLLVFGAVIFLGWHKMALPWMLKKDAWPIVLSGLCTAVIIPTTTLMYLLPISVMVAMVIMRGSVIVISRLIDALLIRQGLLKKKVSWSEELAVFFALLGVGTNLFSPTRGRFEFLHNSTALIILFCYLSAYAIRLYIMNIYKNRNSEVSQVFDNRTFFTIEQGWATLALFITTLSLFLIASTAPESLWASRELQHTVLHPNGWAMASGVAYAGVAFFSVFIFMFPGRTATFAGVANRLTSLSAGTVSTVLLAIIFKTHYPTALEWTSMFWIACATGLLIKAEKEAKVAKAVPVTVSPHAFVRTPAEA